MTMLREKDVAERLAVAPITVQRLADRGELARYKIGRCVRYAEEDVEAYIQRSLISPVAQPEQKQKRGKFAYVPGMRLV